MIQLPLQMTRGMGLRDTFAQRHTVCLIMGSNPDLVSKAELPAAPPSVTVPLALLSGRRPEGGSSRNGRSSLGRQLPRPPSRSSRPLVVMETGRWGRRQDVVSVFVHALCTASRPLPQSPATGGLQNPSAQKETKLWFRETQGPLKVTQ